MEFYGRDWLYPCPSIAALFHHYPKVSSLDTRFLSSLRCANIRNLNLFYLNLSPDPLHREFNRGAATQWDTKSGPNHGQRKTSD
jgi:hypothetical protein